MIRGVNHTLKQSKRALTKDGVSFEDVEIWLSDSASPVSHISYHLQKGFRNKAYDIGILDGSQKHVGKIIGVGTDGIIEIPF